jgi:hypothetical protein
MFRLRSVAFSYFLPNPLNAGHAFESVYATCEGTVSSDHSKG